LIVAGVLKQTNVMLTLISQKSNLQFRFDSGNRPDEEYLGSYKVCPEPNCRCGNIQILLCDASKDKNSRTVYTIALDVMAEDVTEHITEIVNEPEDEEFAHSVADDLSREEWQALREDFWRQKSDIID
jgi:hypothetical protein